MSQKIMNSFKQMKTSVKQFAEKFQETAINKKKQPSKGQLFKQQTGISKTLYRNMKKMGLEPLSGNLELAKVAYKAKRKKWLKDKQLVQKKKHIAAKASRKTKDKTQKGKSQKSKKAD